jgi:hypothetical protein
MRPASGRGTRRAGPRGEGRPLSEMASVPFYWAFFAVALRGFFGAGFFFGNSQART